MSLTKATYSMIYGAPVNVLDYGADPTGVADSTAAFNAAQIAGSNIYVPEGTFVLDNFKPAGYKRFTGSGQRTTTLQQKTTTNPAVYLLANLAEGSKPNVEITELGLSGAAIASAPVLKIEGVIADVRNVSHCTIDVFSLNCYSALEMVGDVYNSKIKVTAANQTTSIKTTGTYNIYDLFVTDCYDAQTIVDTSTSSTFLKAISDGVQSYSGTANRIDNCVVEGWSSSLTSSTVIVINGNYNTFGNIVITDVPSTKATNGVACFNTANSIENLAFRGSVFPTYAVVLDPGSSGSMANVTAIAGTQPYLEDITSGVTLRQWTFSGKCSTFMRASTVRNGLHYHIWDNAIDGFVSGATLKFGANSLQQNYVDCCIVNLNTTFAALTIEMPTAPVNEQTARISCPSSAITSLTLTPNSGATIVGAPAGITASGSISFVYNLSALKWYRVS